MTDEQDRLRMADLWRHQTAEIAEAGIAGEDEDRELEAEKRVLANAEKLYTAAMSAHELLYEARTFRGDDAGPGAEAGGGAGAV